VAGTSSVDYSNQQSQKKLKKRENPTNLLGYDGLTDHAQPPMVIMENVYGAPSKVLLFEERITKPRFAIDTRDIFHIPANRILFCRQAAKQEQEQTGNFQGANMVSKDFEEMWQNYAFMLPQCDDPRVFRGRVDLIGREFARMVLNGLDD
jgi:hypothetical protein